MAQNVRFFLGANTPMGFVSRFDELADVDEGWKLFVIKGGPGSGKSTMMKKVANAAEGEPVEYIYCSSDVDSLDGVILPERKLAIADGTPPHTIEPKYPGAFEFPINITDCWDEGKLFASREQIIDISRRCSQYHEHCCRFLSAAGALITDTYGLVLRCVNTEKLARYCERLIEREFRPKSKSGKEKVRFLSAVTNKGFSCFEDTVHALCNRIFVINDDCGAVSRLLLHTLRAYLLESGYTIISCYCPLSPYEKLEHIFIPEEGIGFVTANHFHKFESVMEPYRIINAHRFSHKEGLRGYRKRIRFNQKAAAGLLAQAAEMLQDAKRLHDELEAYYIHATDFKLVDALTKSVLERMPPRS